MMQMLNPLVNAFLLRFSQGHHYITYWKKIPILHLTLKQKYMLTLYKCVQYDHTVLSSRIKPLKVYNWAVVLMCVGFQINTICSRGVNPLWYKLYIQILLNYHLARTNNVTPHAALLYRTNPYWHSLIFTQCLYFFFPPNYRLMG